MDFFGTQNLNRHTLNNFVVHRGYAFPISYVIGQLFYRLDRDKLYICTATSNLNDLDWLDLTKRAEAGAPGLVVMWAGDLTYSSGYSGYSGTSGIPTGWTLCNGYSGTVDLTDRFVKISDTQYDLVGQSGGTAANHTHSGTLGAHTHTFAINFGQTVCNTREPNGSMTTCSKQDHGHYTGSITSDSSSASGGTVDPASNVPRHLTVAYIMKT